MNFLLRLSIVSSTSNSPSHPQIPSMNERIRNQRHVRRRSILSLCVVTVPLTMMGIVRFNEWMVRHPKILKVPFILCSPSSKSLHLNEGQSFVTRWKSCNDGFIEINMFRYIIGRRLPELKIARYQSVLLASTADCF